MNRIHLSAIVAVLATCFFTAGVVKAQDTAPAASDAAPAASDAAPAASDAAPAASDAAPAASDAAPAASDAAPAASDAAPADSDAAPADSGAGGSMAVDLNAGKQKIMIRSSGGGVAFGIIGNDNDVIVIGQLTCLKDGNLVNGIAECLQKKLAAAPQ